MCVSLPSRVLSLNVFLNYFWRVCAQVARLAREVEVLGNDRGAVGFEPDKPYGTCCGPQGGSGAGLSLALPLPLSLSPSLPLPESFVRTGGEAHARGGGVQQRPTATNPHRSSK